jgi:hypothetical protein
MRFATRRSITLLRGLAEGFEDLKAEFKAEDADRGLGIEPGGGEDDDRFDDLPGFFTIGVGFVGFHDGTSFSSFALLMCQKACCIKA